MISGGLEAARLVKAETALCDASKSKDRCYQSVEKNHAAGTDKDGLLGNEVGRACYRDVNASVALDTAGCVADYYNDLSKLVDGQKAIKVAGQKERTIDLKGAAKDAGVEWKAGITGKEIMDAIKGSGVKVSGSATAQSDLPLDHSGTKDPESSELWKVKGAIDWYSSKAVNLKTSVEWSAGDLPGVVYEERGAFVAGEHGQLRSRKLLANLLEATLWPKDVLNLRFQAGILKPSLAGSPGVGVSARLQFNPGREESKSEVEWGQFGVTVAGLNWATTDIWKAGNPKASFGKDGRDYGFDIDGKVSSDIEGEAENGVTVNGGLSFNPSGSEVPEADAADSYMASAGAEAWFQALIKWTLSLGYEYGVTVPEVSTGLDDPYYHAVTGGVKLGFSKNWELDNQLSVGFGSPGSERQDDVDIAEDDYKAIVVGHEPDGEPSDLTRQIGQDFTSFSSVLNWKATKNFTLGAGYVFGKFTDVNDSSRTIAKHSGRATLTLTF